MNGDMRPHSGVIRIHGDVSHSGLIIHGATSMELFRSQGLTRAEATKPFRFHLQ